MLVRRTTALVATALLIGGSLCTATAAPSQGGGVDVKKITGLVDSAAESGLLPATAPIPDMGGAGKLLGLLSDLPPVFTTILSTPWATTPIVAAVRSEPFEGGTRYIITPATGAADLPATARFAGWTQAMAHGIPDTATLRHQFYCHYDARGFIRNKPSWNIESTRPDRGMEGFYRHWCN